MSPLTRAQRREDEKWAVCRRCGHYAVEHATSGRRCRAEVLRADDLPPDPCDCRGLDPRSVS